LLNQTGQIDLRTLLRSGVTWSQLRQQVAQLLAEKAAINYKLRDSGTTGTYARTMSQIGG
jgi:cyclic pyranopterin phosphate synthase